MKIIIKKYLQDMVTNVDEALETVKTLDIKDGNFTETLAICQDVLIRVGETSGSEGDQAAPMIDNIMDQCKALFQLTSFKEKNQQFQDTFAEIQQRQKDIAGQLAAFNEDKMKAVFMPVEKAQWPALDNIYRAILADGRFDVKILPVPYYQMENGAITEIKCTVSEFSAYPETASCDDYNFDGERPDFVFITNPMDDMGEQVKVKQQYFTDKLKEFTSHLVYVVDSGLDFEQLADNVSQFALGTIPGIANSWRIVVQKSQQAEQLALGGVPKEKIVGLGSTLGEFFSASNEPTDGQSEPVTLCGLYDGLEQQVAGKMKALLDKAVAAGKIKFIDGNGDMSDNMAEAAKAHGYVGPRDSKLKGLFDIFDKPELLVDEIFEERIVGQVTFGGLFKDGCGLEVDGHYIGFLRTANEIIDINLADGQVGFLDGDDSYQKGAKNLYCQVIKWQNQIVFIPEAAGHLMFFDPVSGNKKFVDHDAFGASGFLSVEAKDRIALLPEKLDGKMLMYFAEQGAVSAAEESGYEKLVGVEGLDFVKPFGRAAVGGGKVHRIVRGTNIIQMFDVEQLVMKYFSMDVPEQAVIDLADDGKHLWVLGEKGDTIYVWNKGKENVNRVIKVNDKAWDVKVFGGEIYLAGESKWVWSKDRKHLVGFDRKAHNRVLVETGVSGQDGAVAGFAMEDGRFVIVSGEANLILTVAPDGNVSKMPLSMDQAVLGQLSQLDYHCESSQVGLEQFVEIVEKWKAENAADKGQNTKASGTELWNQLINEFFN